MKLTSAQFRFGASATVSYIVSFYPDETAVVVCDRYCKKLLTVDNKKGEYKPCVTHATELLKLALNKPSKSNFAKRRTKAMKPKLKVAK